jgi:hypothetical protein
VLALDSQVLWWGPGATGPHGAGRFVAHARDVLAAAAPREWCASSAQLYVERLGDLLRDCGRVARDVEEAEAQVRLLEAELAEARSALGPTLVFGGAR